MNSTNVSRPNRQPMNTGKKKDRNMQATQHGQRKSSAQAAGGKNESKGTEVEKMEETQTIEAGDVSSVANVLAPDGSTGTAVVAETEQASAEPKSSPAASKGPKPWKGWVSDTKYELKPSQAESLLVLERALFLRRQTKNGYPTQAEFEAKMDKEGVNKELDEKVSAMMKDRWATAPDEADKPYTTDDDILRAFIVTFVV